jgi:hypothetical protein
LRLISKLKKTATVRGWNESKSCARQMVQASNRQGTGRQLANFSPSFQCVVRNYFDFSCLEYAWLG